jgi:serine phosphatase RsbU (regulator of sigma subunit)
MAQLVIVGAATRPYPGEVCNGDAWQVDWHEGRCRLAIIDGLGHGEPAANAANSALRALEAQPELSPEASLRVCHAALRSTRGAAVSVALIDPVLRQLTYCGVGNTEAGLLIGGRWEHLVAYRGIVGAIFPKLRSFSHALERDWMLIMYTDGIRSGFRHEALANALVHKPQTLADAILRGWARETDDATVLVARPDAPQVHEFTT